LSRTGLSRPRAAALALLASLAVLAAGCGYISFGDHPASGYGYATGVPLRVAVIDETGGADWTPAVQAATADYAAATPYLDFVQDPAAANIVINVYRYSDSTPPQIRGYLFPFGAGGFTTVYDETGAACNFPPSTLPENCDGEIATADIYLNDAIPAGADIDARRERLVRHELGHALGLQRHSPDLDIASLAERYGWP
jgi:hypothetical protein